MLQSNEIFILSIESSCDDTSAAVLRDQYVVSNVVAGQKVHEKYGGVVPELASRAHQQNIVAVVDVALKEAGITPGMLSAIAYTNGPGLLGSLLVGTSFAKSMSLALNIPLLDVNHMQAHVSAHFINNRPAFPFLCLTVSGGHTQIVRVKDHRSMEVIGQTLDDAAGEAFDKGAKILGLPYPGGPLIDRYAQQGNAHRFSFPVPRLQQFDFSFSGIKTSFLYFIQKESKANPRFVEDNLPDICASYQRHIVSYLLRVFLNAAEATGITELALAGGVSANSFLRQEFNALSTQGYKVHIPAFEYCTDNAAMIGIAGYYKFLSGEFAPLELSPYTRGGF